ncbi:MAG: MarR family winged helix-turn-helix transcriptional regulator [Pseudomonadota bacterium]
MMDSPYRLQASLGYKLSLAARLQERRLEADLKSLGLTRTTWCVLLAVAVEGLSKPSEIAAFIGIDRTATSRALRHMEEQRLIARSGRADDKRFRTVKITQTGQELLDKGSPMARANNVALSAKLSEAEEVNLMKALNSLIRGEPAGLSRF